MTTEEDIDIPTEEIPEVPLVPRPGIVIVARERVPEVDSATGLFIPEETRAYLEEFNNRAIVLAIGPPEDPDEPVDWIRPGDLVFVAPYAGLKIDRMGPDKLLFAMRFTEILAVYDRTRLPQFEAEWKAAKEKAIAEATAATSQMRPGLVVPV